MFNEYEVALPVFYEVLSNGFNVQSVILIIASFFVVAFLLLICCVVCCSVGVQWKNNFKSKWRNPDSSYRIFTKQERKSRFCRDPEFVYTVPGADRQSLLRTDSKRNPSGFPRNFYLPNALPNLYGDVAHHVRSDNSITPHSLYVTSIVLMDGTKTEPGQSLHSGSSRKILIPYGPDRFFDSSPQMSPSQGLIGFKGPDSYFQSETASTLADTISAGLDFTKMARELVLQPPTDSSHPGVGLPRGSLVSADLPKMHMQTFKPS
ncbi:hypothetical protein V3C99_001778 [Haemonchus contortus]